MVIRIEHWDFSDLKNIPLVGDNTNKMQNPLPPLAEERVDQRSVVGVSHRHAG
ncbi:MAG: hypothetical protein ACXVAY_09210 [Mucilaginibacter sp.]